jgi:hypothetical protein
VQPPLAVACFPIEGKTISPTPIAARLVAIGPSGADLLLESPVAERSNLKILLAPTAGGGTYEIFGKVIETGNGHVRLAFTSLSDGARAYLGARARGGPRPT